MTRLLLPLLALAAGCTASLNVGGPCKDFDTGEEPCRQQFYFPTGVAADPDPGSDSLYVASSNADLRYSGGTVAAIDLKRFECALAFARTGALPMGEGCETHLVGLYQVKSNTMVRVGDQVQVFRLTDPDPTVPGKTVVEADAADCHADLLDPRVLECQETRFITSAVKTGNFAGSIRVQSKPNRLWMPVRGDPSITFIDLQKPSQTDPKAAAGTLLGCRDPQNGDPARRLNSCNTQRVTVRDYHGPMPECMSDMDCPGGVTCSSNKCKRAPLPPEPFGIYLDEGADYARLAISHLLGGEVTIIDATIADPATSEDVQPKSQQVVKDVRGGLFSADSAGRRGAFALAPIHPGAPRDKPSFWYVTSRLSPSVAMFRIADIGDLILPAPGFTAGGGPFLAGDDVRDVAVQQDGVRAFFIQNHPPSLFTVDTRPQESSTTGYPENTIVDIVDVCQGPSHLGLRQWSETGAPGEQSRVVTRAYVVCFATGQIAVVDPDLAIVADTILVGRGPNDIAFNFADFDSTVVHRRAFVTNFTDSNVSVIDLERGSPTENRVIARIGVSSPPVQQ